MTIRSRSRLLTRLAIALPLLLGGAVASAACHDSVLMVHGNTGSPSDWNGIYNKLRNNGWSSGEIVRASWGSQYCAGCNDHYGSELNAVKSALNTAISRSCTGKVDVLGHSMGVTLAAKAIVDLNKSSKVNSFIGIAGALRGLNSCGTYPFNVWSTTCGYWGLSKNNGLVNAIENRRYGAKVYSIKSYFDQVVCAMGGCYVNGTHTSNIYYQNATYTYNTLGHFGLQSGTVNRQYDLINR